MPEKLIDFDSLSPAQRKALIEKWKEKIGKMSHIDMCRFYRFSNPGHPVFHKNLPLWDHFMKRYNSLGGMTPEISKAIGWKKGD